MAYLNAASDINGFLLNLIAETALTRTRTNPTGIGTSSNLDGLEAHIIQDDPLATGILIIIQDGCVRN